MSKKPEKRTVLEKRDGIQNVLESYRRFDYDYIPFGNNWTSPKAEYNYRQHPLSRCATFLLQTLMRIFAPILLWVAYGARVTGKKNLKSIKKQGALCVCNHISYLDTLFVRHAVGYFRSYHTMAPYNNKNGLAGWFIRRAAMLPFSESFDAMKNLNKEMKRLLEKGKIINFYAERAMWTNYQKPRPVKEGAFAYALKFNVPVIPLFCTFKKDKKGRIRKLKINILPPVFPDETLIRRERITAMAKQVQNKWKECYEAAYGTPLEYLPDIRKNKR